jgi:hypothetical protein
MTILEFLRSINGYGQLWSADGQFLGLLSSNQNDINSITNPNTFGNPYSYNSIRNASGIYGSPCGIYSPYNSLCLNPPVVLYQNQPVLVMTRNSLLFTNGLPIIDPDLVLSVYLQLASAIPNPAVDLLQTYIQMRNDNGNALAAVTNAMRAW